VLIAVNNSFPNIKLKSATWENENSIKSFKPKNTYGYDESNTDVLKISSVYTYSPLNHICSTSLSLGTFPQCLKHSVVKPLYKKG